MWLDQRAHAIRQNIQPHPWRVHRYLPPAGAITVCVHGSTRAAWVLVAGEAGWDAAGLAACADLVPPARTRPPSPGTGQAINLCSTAATPMPSVIAPTVPLAPTRPARCSAPPRRPARRRGGARYKSSQSRLSWYLISFIRRGIPSSLNPSGSSRRACGSGLAPSLKPSTRPSSRRRRSGLM
jgi:hypothetical protein